MHIRASYPLLSSAVGVETATLPRQVGGDSGNVPFLSTGQRGGVQRVLADYRRPRRPVMG